MPNINDFKVALVEGGARNNQFRVRGRFPFGDGGAGNTLEFLCRSAQLPAFSLNPVTVPYRGRILKLAGDREFAEWTITIINDSTFKLRNAFEKWNNQINKVINNTSLLGLSSYSADWTVEQLKRDGTLAKTYRFIDCWPSNISAIDLNADPATSVEEFTITVQYQYYETLDGTTT